MRHKKCLVGVVCIVALAPSLSASSNSCHIGGIQITEQAKQVGVREEQAWSDCQLHLVSPEQRKAKVGAYRSFFWFYIPQSFSVFFFLAASV